MLTYCNQSNFSLNKIQARCLYLCAVESGDSGHSTLADSNWSTGHPTHHCTGQGQHPCSCWEGRDNNMTSQMDS